MNINTQTRHNCVMSGFDVERLRKKLLAEGKIDELIDTYSKEWPSIVDKNTPDFWEKKFRKHTFNNPQEVDRNRIVASLIKENDVVLDIGVGKGLIENELRKKKISLTGTDFTKKNIEKLVILYPQWKFTTKSLNQLNNSGQLFDKVLLLEVIEHIPPSKTFKLLRNINQLLKKHGELILSIPVNEGLEEMYPMNPNAHVRVYSKDLIKFEIEQNGFAVKKVIELTAFSRFYFIKKFINRLLKIRKSNNLIIIAQKK